jgi:hypothetical protein
MMTSLPDGWDVMQMRAEHPTATYDSFHDQLINEQARPANMPKNNAKCDSSQYNNASGRLDHKTYYKAIRIDQEACERLVLNRLLRVWVREAALAGVIPAALAREEIDLPHQWFWDGQELLDPREANATDVGLKNGSLTMPTSP